jgi:spore germination protein GerM
MTKNTIIIILITIIIALMGTLAYVTLDRNQYSFLPELNITPSPPPITEAPLFPTPSPDNPQTSPSPMTIVVFFSNPTRTDECNQVFPVQRSIESTQAVARASIQELLKGPANNEAAAGHQTNLPSGVAIQNLVVENGTATIDFNQALNAVGGSCRVTAIRAQITNTLLQFPTVNEVVITVNGDADTALQP